MGKRARRAGIANAAVRAARKVFGEHEARATQISGDIFNVAMEQTIGHQHPGHTADPLPLEMRAPLTYLGIRCTPYILKRSQLPATPENEADIIAYLTEAYCQVFVEFDVEHFEQWRRSQNTLAAVLGICAHCQKPGGEHRLDDAGLRWCDDGTLAALPEFRLDDEQPEAAQNPYEDELLARAWDHGRRRGLDGLSSVLKLEDLPEDLRAVAKPGLAQAWQAGWAIGTEERGDAS